MPQALSDAGSVPLSRPKEFPVAVTGVFCTRVRVEEKQIIGAFGDAGAVAMPVLPASTPMPPGPATRSVSSVVAEGTLDINDPALTVLIDRCPNRYVAEATLPLIRARGVRVVGAGIAATGSRLDIASALESAGIARPSTLLAFTEDSANLAVRQIGVPASLFSLNPGKGWTLMQDYDTADAVIEHRMVLGRDAHSVVLVQAGAPMAHELTTIHVVADKALASEGSEPTAEAIALAERASRALDASLVSIQTATVSGELVVWDVLPAAEFRSATLLGDESIAGAIARLTLSGESGKSGLGDGSAADASTTRKTEVRHGVNGIALNA
jgi:hypothetical protein